MKRSRFNEEQIIAILREQEAGMKPQTRYQRGNVLSMESQVSSREMQIDWHNIAPGKDAERLHRELQYGCATNF